MATSNQTIFQLTRDQLITSVLQKIGVLGEGTVANATQLADAQIGMNVVISQFQILGMPLWKRKELTVPLVAGQSTYTVGVGQAIAVPFPLKLSQCVLTLAGNNSKTDIEIVASYNFSLLPLNSAGTPVQITYQPFINYGEIKVWPTPDNSVPVGSTLTVTYQSPVEVFTGASDTLDFPQEWYSAVIYHTALYLSDDYGLPIPDKQWLEKQAEKHLASALAFGTEETSLFLYPSSES